MASADCSESKCTVTNSAPKNCVNCLPLQYGKTANDAKNAENKCYNANGGEARTSPQITLRCQDSKDNMSFDMANVENAFMVFEVPMKEYTILKSGCETIKGMLTISEQDFPTAFPLLDEHLSSVLSADILYIFVAERFRHLFKDNAHVQTEGSHTLHSFLETVKKNQSFSLIVVDSSTKASVVQAINESNIYETCVLVVGKAEEMEIPPNVLISETESEVTVKDADHLLERCAFRILKQLYLKLQEFEQRQSFDEQERESLQDIYDMINAAFKRSMIPKAEYPKVQEEFLDDKDILEKAAKVLDGEPGIIGYVNTRGILQIYIETSANSEESNIRRDLQNNGVTRVQFLRRTTKKLCSSGDSLSGYRGTLGGFVKKVNVLPTVSVKDSAIVAMPDAATSLAIPNFPLVALVSRHAVQGQEFLIVGRGNRTIGRIVRINADTGNDILPVDVYEDCRNVCVNKFKTETNVEMRDTRLMKSDVLESLRGVPVHIWSEKSAPGLGILYRNNLRNLNSRRIIVRDRNLGADFAQDGDSGAMVCFVDAHNDQILFAVAMVVEIMENPGDRTRREYTAQILDYALQNLSMKSLEGWVYEFIEDDVTE